MPHLVSGGAPTGILSTLPGIDVEISLARPVDGPVWRSIVGDVRLASGISTKRGRSKEVDQFQAGTLGLVLDNRDREYDPDYTASPIAGYIKPEKRIRVLATYNSIQYVVFDGFVDGFNQQYDVSGKDATAEINASDGFKALARMNLPNSTYDFLYQADPTLTPPVNSWRFTEGAGSTFTFDDIGGVTLAVNAGADLGGASVMPYGDDNTSATFDGSASELNGARRAFSNATEYTGPLTVEAWFNASTINAAASAAGWPIIEWDAGLFRLFSDRIQLAGGRYTTIKSLTTNISSGTATHVAVTQDTLVGGTVLCYLNGGFAGTASIIVGGTVSAFEGVTIGVLKYQLDHADGTIDAVYNYNQVLTAAEILDHYNLATSANAGESSGTRVTKVLQFVPWPDSDIDVDDGSSTLAAHSINGASALGYLQTLWETERGQFYMGIDGNMSSKGTFDVVWRSRGSLISAARSISSQATFGDTALQYAGIRFTYDDTLLVNDVERSRNGGASQRVQDDDSMADYFRRSDSKTDLLFESDADASDAALSHLFAYKDPALRVESMTIKPQADPTNLWPQVLGREIGDRITVQLTPQQVGTAISKDLIIEGVSHSFAEGEWVTNWDVSPVDATTFWILDDPVYSILGSTTVLAR